MCQYPAAITGPTPWMVNKIGVAVGEQRLGAFDALKHLNMQAARGHRPIPTRFRFAPPSLGASSVRSTATRCWPCGVQIGSRTARDEPAQQRARLVPDGLRDHAVPAIVEDLHRVGAILDHQRVAVALQCGDIGGRVDPFLRRFPRESCRTRAVDAGSASTTFSHLPTRHRCPGHGVFHRPPAFRQLLHPRRQPGVIVDRGSNPGSTPDRCSSPDRPLSPYVSLCVDPYHQHHRMPPPESLLPNRIGIRGRHSDFRAPLIQHATNHKMFEGGLRH